MNYLLGLSDVIRIFLNDITLNLLNEEVFVIYELIFHSVFQSFERGSLYLLSFVVALVSDDGIDVLGEISILNRRGVHIQFVKVCKIVDDVLFRLYRLVEFILVILFFAVGALFLFASCQEVFVVYFILIFFSA